MFIFIYFFYKINNGNSASTDNQEQKSFNNYSTNVPQQTQPQMRQNVRQV